MLGGMADVTQILAAVEAGHPTAAAELLPLVYDELRKLAAARLADEKPGQTLQATALVHEAYARLVGPGGGDGRWAGRGHFFAAAAEAMRRILVDQARRKQSERKGGDRVRLDVDEAAPYPAAGQEPERILAIDEALSLLEAESPMKAQLVHLRFFV